MYTLTLSAFISPYTASHTFSVLSPFSLSLIDLDLMDTSQNNPFTAHPDLSRYDPKKLRMGEYQLPGNMARNLSQGDQKHVEDMFYRALAAHEAAGGRDPQTALLGVPEHNRAFRAGKIPLEKMLGAARVFDAEQRGEISHAQATRLIEKLGVPQHVSTIGQSTTPSSSPQVTQEQRRREIEASRATTQALYEKTAARVRAQVVERATGGNLAHYTAQQQATIQRLAQKLVEHKIGFMRTLSDEQAKAVIDPSRAVMIQGGGGAGKSATIAARIVHDVVNNQVDASQITVLGPTHSTKDALSGLLTELESILPGFDLSGRNAPRTQHSFGMQYLNAPLRDASGKILVDDEGQPLKPMTMMNQGALRDYRPIGIAGRQFRNAEQARDAMQSAQKMYFEKVLQHYALRGKVPQVDDTFNRIQQVKTSASRDSALYTQTVKKGREDWNAGRRTTQEALFFAYESHLKNRPGFSTPGQSKPYYDLSDTITLAANAAKERGTPRARYLVLDEFQDASPESLRMLANMADPHTRIMLAGDMGQKTIKSGLRVDQLAHAILGKQGMGISEHQLTGNYRSGPWTVAMMRAMQGEKVLEGRSGSPPQISMRANMDLPPTFGVGRNFKETYEGMITDMVRTLGLSMESIGENIKTGQHPLAGSSLTPQQAPALMQMKAQRDIFRQTLESMLGQQVGLSRAKSAMGEMYSESTPSAGTQQSIHALLEGQARSRMFEHPFIDTTRVGSKWSDADYLEALQTMVGRTGTQMHLYQSMENITGSNYNLTPGNFLGQTVPQNFDRWTQQSIGHLQDVYGLSDAQIAPQLQQSLQIPIRAASQSVTEDPGATQKYFQDLIGTNGYYQPAVNSGVGGVSTSLDSGVGYERDNESGAKHLTTGFTDQGVFNRNTITGKYKLGPDTSNIQFGVESLRNILQQGDMYRGSIPASLEEALSSPMFSQYRSDERIESPYAANQRDLTGLQKTYDPQSGEINRLFMPTSGTSSRMISSPRGDDFHEIREFGRTRSHLPTGKRGFSAESHGYMYKGEDVDAFQGQLFGFMNNPKVWQLPGMREALATKADDPKLIQHALKIDSVRGKGPLAQQASTLVSLRNAILENGRVQGGREEFLGLSGQYNEISQRTIPDMIRQEIMGGSGTQLHNAIMNKAAQLLSFSSSLPGGMLHQIADAAEYMADASSDPDKQHQYNSFAEAVRTRAGKDVVHSDTQGLTMSEEELAWVHKNRPEEGALLERMLRGENGKLRNFEHPEVKKQIAQLTFARGTQARYMGSSSEAQRLGVSLANSRMAPYQTELAALGDRMILDPQAVRAMNGQSLSKATLGVLDAQFPGRKGAIQAEMRARQTTFQSLGAGVTLPNFQKRMEDMLGRRNLSPQQHDLALEHLRAMKGMRYTLNNPDWQRYGGHFMNVLGWASMGKGPLDLSLNETKRKALRASGQYITDPMDFLFKNQRQDYKEGTRTFAAMQEFVGALNEGITHLHTTGTIKRGHIDRILTALGHDTQSPEFAPLHALPGFSSPDATMDVQALARQYPRDTQNLLGQMTRMPFRPGEDAIYMGGVPGFTDPSIAHTQVGLTPGTRGYLAPYAPGDQFGSSKYLGLYRKPDYRLLTQGEFSGGIPMSVPGSTPMEPVYRMVIPNTNPGEPDTAHYVRHSQLAGLGWMGQTPEGGEGGNTPSSSSSRKGLIGALAAAGASVSPLVMAALPHISGAFHGLMSHPAVSAMLMHPALPSMMSHPGSILPHIAMMAMAGVGGGTPNSLIDVISGTKRGNKGLGIPPPSDEQLAFMTSGEKKRVVEGGPGAGKTGTLARTIAYLIAQRKTLPQNVLTLTALRSAVSKFNEGLSPYRKMFPGHDKAYQIPTPITYHSLGTQTIFGNAYEDEGGKTIYPMLQQMGLGHLTGQILSNPSQDDLLGMNPDEQKRALKESQSTYIRGTIDQHTGTAIGDYQLDDFVKHIGEVKKNRQGVNSPYNTSLQLGYQALREGKMNKHAALALYETTREKAGIIDQDDVPVIAANMYEQLGARAVPARYQGTQIVGMDEGQDQNFEVARMMKGFLGAISGNDPHVLVGLDLMQSLTQGMGGTPVGQVRGLYRNMLDLPGGNEPFHQLTKNFRSSIGDIAMNNAILAHPALAHEPKSPFQVPGLPNQRVGVFPSILTAKSQPRLYQQMFASQLEKAGLSMKDVAANVKGGKHPLAGFTTSPSQIPAIFSRNQDEKLFQHVAKQALVGEGLSRKQAEAAWSQMYRTGTPGVNATDEQKKLAEGQFWGLTHRGARAWDWLFPHVDATQFKGWDVVGNIRNRFVGGSRPQQEGQNVFGAASHPFTAAQFRQYIGGADFEDLGMPDRGEVLLGGKAIRQSPINTFEKVGTTFVPSHFKQFLESRAQSMIAMGVDPQDPAVMGGLVPPPAQWGRQVPPSPPPGANLRRPVPSVPSPTPGATSPTMRGSQRRPPPIPAPGEAHVSLPPKANFNLPLPPPISGFPRFDDPLGTNLTPEEIQSFYQGMSSHDKKLLQDERDASYKRGMFGRTYTRLDRGGFQEGLDVQRTRVNEAHAILQGGELPGLGGTIDSGSDPQGLKKSYQSSAIRDLVKLQGLHRAYEEKFPPIIQAKQVNVQIAQGQVNVNPAQSVPITGSPTLSRGTPVPPPGGGTSIPLGPAIPSSSASGGPPLPPIPTPGRRAGLGGSPPPIAGGSGIGNGGGIPPATIVNANPPGGGPPNAYGRWNNDASNAGRSLTRIGNEMQFIGKAISQSVDQAISQGSQYRRATFGLAGSGPTGTEGFYDPRITLGTVTGQADTISTYQNNFLPMYSRTQIAQGYQGLTGLSNTPNIGLGALSATMGMSALAGVDPSQLMQSMAQIGGISGQAGKTRSYGNLTGMLYQMYGKNVSPANVTPTLQALSGILPSMQGLDPGSTTQAAQAMALFQTALGSGMSPANLPDVANTLGALSQLGSNPDLQQQYALQQSGYHLTSDVALTQFQSERVGRAEQIAQLGLQQNINGQGLSLPQLNIQIDQAQIQMSRAQLDMSGLQLGAAQLSQQGAVLQVGAAQLAQRGNVLQVGMSELQQKGAVLDYQHALAGYQFNLGVQNTLYGPIGADRSRLSGYSFQQNQLVAQRNPLQSQIGVTFNPSQVFGLRNQEFYAGLQNQQQSLILGRSPLLSDALFQQQMKYIKQQADFYEKELAITNAQRAFEKDWTARLLDQQKRVVDYNARLVAQQERVVAYNAKLVAQQEKEVAYNARLVAEQGYIYGLQQQQYKLEVEKNLYDQKVQKINQDFLGQQAAALQAVQGALDQFINGQGPINGGNLQPMDLVTTLAKQFKGQPDDALKGRVRQLLPNDLADQNILFKLVKATEDNPAKLTQTFQKLSQADQKQFMAAFQQAIKNGNFTDLVQQRTTQDQALLQAGVGKDWQRVRDSINTLATVMPRIAQDFAWMSGLAPWAGMIISYAGTAMVVMGTVLNALGLVQALAKFFGLTGGGSAFANLLSKLPLFGGGGGVGGTAATTGGSILGPILGAVIPVAGVAVGEFLIAKWLKDNHIIPDAPKTGPTWITHQPTKPVNWPWDNPPPPSSPGMPQVGGPHWTASPPSDDQMNRRTRDQHGATFVTPPTDAEWNKRTLVPRNSGDRLPWVPFVPDDQMNNRNRDQGNRPKVQEVKDTANLDQAKQNAQHLVELRKQWAANKPTQDQIQKNTKDAVPIAGATLDASKAHIQRTVELYKQQMQHKQTLDQTQKNTRDAIPLAGASLDQSKAHTANLVELRKQSILHKQALDQGNKQTQGIVPQIGISNAGIKNNVNTTGHGFAMMKGNSDTTNKTLHDSKDIQNKSLDHDKNIDRNTSMFGQAFAGFAKPGGGEAGGMPAGHPGFITPHVNAEFGAQMWYGKHQGVDFNAAQGTPLHEYIGGVVKKTGFYPWGGEIDVGIPGTPLIERYLHMSMIGVTPGQPIGRGQFIGLTGGGTPQSGFGYWSHGAHQHSQIDTGNMNAALNPWPIWAMFGATNLAQNYGGNILGKGANKMAMGGIAMRPTRADLGDGGEPEAVIPLSKLSMVMSSIPQSRTGGTSNTIPSQKSVVIQKLTDKVEVHLHLSTATISDQEKDSLMAQTLEVLGQAVEHFAGHLQ